MKVKQKLARKRAAESRLGEEIAYAKMLRIKPETPISLTLNIFMAHQMLLKCCPEFYSSCSHKK